MTRRCVLSILLCALLFGSTGCSLFDKPGPQDAFRAFADALGRKDGPAAAATTDDQTAATSAITSMVDGMGKDATLKVAVSPPGDDEKTAKLTYSWSFGPDRKLDYDVAATATQSGDDWQSTGTPPCSTPSCNRG